MDRFAELTTIADRLDTLGLHREASLVDRYLHRRAATDLLAYREKPFLAQLARIALAVKGYNLDERIRGKEARFITFPVSEKSIFGLTKNEVLEQVAEHLKAFIEDYLIPQLRDKYTDTRHEDAYQRFIDGVQDLLGKVESAFIGKKEKEEIHREISTTLDKTRDAIRQLSIYTKTTEQFNEVREIQRKASDIIEKLRRAVAQKRPQSELEDIMDELKELFDVDIDSNLGKVVVEAAGKEGLTYQERNEVSSRLREELEGDEDAIRKRQEVDYNYSHYIRKKKSIDQQTSRSETLNREWQRVAEDIARTQSESWSIYSGRAPKEKEEMAKLARGKRVTYKKPPSRVYHRTSKTLRDTEDDIARLANHLENYKETAVVTGENQQIALSQVVPFSWYIGFQNPQVVQEIVGMISQNLSGLIKRLHSDEDKVVDELYKWTMQGLDIKTQENRRKKELYWDTWRNKYIAKTWGRIEAFLPGKYRSTEETVDRQQEALNAFKTVLEYSL